MSDKAPSPATRTWFGHPPGLTILFLTETTAYFSAYGMQALLVLYMVQSMGLGQAKASSIYGLYVGAANLTPLLGGWIADRFIGQHRSVTLGAALMALGHGVMTFPSGLYLGLGLVALGNGFFITSLVSRIGALYAPEDPRRDRAYIVYYLGINLGGFLSPLACGWLAQHYGWHAGFGAAAIVMAAGLAFYLLCLPLVPRGAAVAAETTTEAKPSTETGRRPIAILVQLLAAVVLFRLGYEQMGNTIALWIDGHVDRVVGSLTVPTPWFQSLNPLFIFLLTPLLAFHWRRREEAGAATSPFGKMTIGACFAATAFLILAIGALRHAGQAPIGYILAYFLTMTIAELHIIPIGLAMVGRLSSRGNGSTMIGLWYFVKFVAGLSAGLFGTLWSVMSPLFFFTINLALAGATIALMLWLRNREAAEPAGR